MIKKQIDYFNVSQIAGSGQCFRMVPEEPGGPAGPRTETEGGWYRVISGEHFLRIRQENDIIEFDCPEAESGFWQRYFDLDTDYGAVIRGIPEKDRYLTEAARAGQGIRILRQDAWEMILSFIISQQKTIPMIQAAVEAGERLGFLPGDLQNKVDPYLRPLYDALFDMLGTENYAKYLERGNIEVAPLAYMRGRTLDDSFIILDEAQNTSREQMKMFLTRLGFGSKIVITGDVTQIDLPADKVSGLKEAMRVLNGVEDIAICRLNEADVVRHVIVQRIIKAYEDDENRRRMPKKK